MRGIKFRAWDKTENRMARNIVDLRFNSKGLYAVIVDHMGFDFKRRANDVDLMEYTGLKDRNGKEIYEWDVVRAFKHGDTETKPFVHQITFRNGTFWFGNWNWIEFLNIFRFIEVIGNIHENPEMLEV